MNPEDGLTIVVIDDSEIIQSALKNFFSDYKSRVVSCSQGLEGIQKVITYQPDIIFLDLMMPEFNGINTLKVLKSLEQTKDIPVIVISSNTIKENVLKVLKLGASKVISKPIQKDIIYKYIKEVLGEGSLIKTKLNNLITENESKSVVNFLRSSFLKSFPLKVKTISEAIIKNDVETLSSVIHQLKGEGGVVGFNSITNICKLIERELSKEEINWDLVTQYCTKIFNSVNEKKLLTPIVG